MTKREFIDLLKDGLLDFYLIHEVNEKRIKDNMVKLENRKIYTVLFNDGVIAEYHESELRQISLNKEFDWKYEYSEVITDTTHFELTEDIRKYENKIYDPIDQFLKGV